MEEFCAEMVSVLPLFSENPFSQYNGIGTVINGKENITDMSGTVEN